MSEQEVFDRARLRAELGLPPVGQCLNRDQSLRYLRALWGELPADLLAQARVQLYRPAPTAARGG